MSVKIAIIGASNQQNPLIVKAKERGYETHTFAWHDGADVGRHTSDYFYPISTLNKEEILLKCKEIGVDAVASIGSDVSAQAAAYVASDMGLAGNRACAVAVATNKILTRKRFDEYSVPQPAYAEIGDAVSFDRIRSMKYPLIVKPSDRWGAKGIRVIEEEREFFGAINEARDLSFERKAIVEEYISGKTYGCECISENGMHRIVGYTQRETALINGKPCEYKHIQPAVIPRSVLKRLEIEIPRALDALGITSGVSSAEFIIDGDGNIYFVKVSPYMYGEYVGTDLVPAAYGVDLTSAVLDIAVGEHIDVSPRDMGVVATVEFEYSRLDGARSDVSISTVPVKEFGGHPALRLNAERSYYSEGENTLALSSEYAAFRYALKMLSPTRIHIPYYSSPAFARMAEEADIDCLRYHIGEDFMPVDIKADESDAVLLVNYHGLCADKIKSLKFEKKIIDNSMSFYQEPVLEEGTYNIYSCRKFFAVADGAYLISSSLASGERIELERDVSYKRAAALLKSLELGESAAYKDAQTSEQELAKKNCKMSVLTEKMLSAVDYNSEREARKRNFAILHGHLKKFNLIQFDGTPHAVPQYYPLLADGDIRAHLLAKRIFVPLMWRSTLSAEFDGLLEKTLSEKLVCLPISPEYSESDMEYLAETVVSLMT